MSIETIVLNEVNQTHKLNITWFPLSKKSKVYEMKIIDKGNSGINLLHMGNHEAVGRGREGWEGFKRERRIINVMCVTNSPQGV